MRTLALSSLLLSFPAAVIVVVVAVVAVVVRVLRRCCRVVVVVVRITFHIGFHECIGRVLAEQRANVRKHSLSLYNSTTLSLCNSRLFSIESRSRSILCTRAIFMTIDEDCG